ncbi:hypothetical protein [Catenulispora subtropica]|uniref:Uncharacterized protein n=1 Tax=Catenulispora subtropica TaxID=450798 RepID=A0ABP5EES0_9ACTN
MVQTSTDLWLLPEDEVLLGQHITAAFPDAAWRCSQPGPRSLHQLHLHPTIETALTCGGVQAFLSLPIGASLPADVEPVDGVRPPTGPPTRAIVQLLRSQIVSFSDEHFRSGRLAVRWFESDVDPDTHRLLPSQTRAIWTALKAATRVAHIERPNGSRLTGTRIGPAAHDKVLRDSIALGRPGAERFQLIKPARA